MEGHRLATEWTHGNQPTCPWSVFLEIDSRDAPRSQEEGSEPSRQLLQLRLYQPDHVQWAHHSSNVPAEKKIRSGLSRQLAHSRSTSVRSRRPSVTGQPLATPTTSLAGHSFSCLGVNRKKSLACETNPLRVRVWPARLQVFPPVPNYRVVTYSSFPGSNALFCRRELAWKRGYHTYGSYILHTWWCRYGRGILIFR